MRIIRNSLWSKLNLITEKDFPNKGIGFVEINPLIIEKETFKEIIDRFVEYLSDVKLDYIIGTEARGFLFGDSIADRLGIEFIPVRKKGKLSSSTVEKAFEYEKEYGKDILELN